MFRLTWNSVLSRRANLLGSLVAVVIAVATMFPAVILIKAASDGPGITERYDTATLIVRSDPVAQFDATGEDFSAVSPPRVSVSLVEEIEAIEAIDGVHGVVPDVLFPAQILDEAGQPVVVSGDAVSRGQSWEAAVLTPFTLVEGTAPDDLDEIVIDRGLAVAGDVAVGDNIIVVGSELPAIYSVTGIAATPDGDGLTRQSTIYFTTDVAMSLANAHGSADVIGVLAEPGVDTVDLEQRVDGALAEADVEVLSGAARARADVTSGAIELTDFVALVGVMSGFVGFVSIFVLASTFAFSIQQRYREIGLQRAIGVTPRQVRRMIAGEALILGLVGSGIGIALGSVLSRVFISFAVGRGLAPEGFTAPFWFWALPIVVGGAIAITQVAAFGSGRRASRIRPIDALREAAVQKKLIGFRRLLLGVAFLVGGLVMLAIAPSMAMDAAVAMSLGEAILLMIGFAILGPVVVVPFTWLVGRLLAVFSGVTGDLARWNARRMPQRVASVVSPLMLAIGFATLMFALTATSQTATIDQTRERTTADIVVVPTNDGLPLGVESEIAAIPGVASANATIPTIATRIERHADWTDVMDYAMVGVDPDTIGASLDFDFTSGGLDQFTGSAVLLSEYAAGEFNAEAGDTITIYLDDLSPIEVNVAGVFSNGLGLADIVAPRDAIIPHTTVALADAVLVDLDPGTDADAVLAKIASLAESGLQLEAMPREDYVAGTQQSMVDGEWVTYLIIGSAAVFAGLSVVNTMTMSTAERAREFALMRLIGATERQVLAMIGGESAIVLVIGAATGVVIGVTSMVGVSIGLIGSVAALTVPLWPVLGIVAIAAVVSCAAHVIPARIVLRTDPITQIGSNE